MASTRSTLQGLLDSPIAKYADSDSTRMLRASVSPVLRATLAALRPSFLGRHTIKKPRRMHRTSYLDGLRGVAALFVVFNHYVSQFFPTLAHGWRNDHEGPDANGWLIQMPALRVVYSGRFMVTIFFVISGYVLSYKALGLARQRQWSTLLRSLASSVFRRWIRLMLPALASLFIGFLLVRARLAPALYMGWADGPAAATLRPGVRREFDGARLPERLDTTAAQFWEWAGDARTMVDPFRFGAIQWPKYNIVLWTMQVEYMGSMVVFATVLGVALAKPWVRFAAPSMLSLYCAWTGRWVWALFIAGMLLAELALDNIARSAPPPTHNAIHTNGTDIEKATAAAPPTHRRPQSLWHYAPDTAAFLVAIYIGTYPEHYAETSPGYRRLSTLIPSGFDDSKGQFYPMVAAVLLVFFLENATFLQAMFTTPTAQYLGDISLSLYMLHTHVELSLGNFLVPHCLRLASGFGPLSFTVGMTVAFACCAVVTIWVSDIFWRLIDQKSVRLARWASVQCFVEDEEKEKP